MKQNSIFNITKLIFWTLIIVSLIGSVLLFSFLGFLGLAEAHRPLSFKEWIGFNDKIETIQSYKMPALGSFFQRRPWFCCYFPNGSVFGLSVIGLIIIHWKETKKPFLNL